MGHFIISASSLSVVNHVAIEVFHFDRSDLNDASIVDEYVDAAKVTVDSTRAPWNPTCLSRCSRCNRHEK